jgi:uncharacterized membrane protein
MRKYILAGLLVWLPIWGTYAILRFILKLIETGTNDLLKALPPYMHPNYLLGFDIPGTIIGIVITLIILIVTGLIATNFLGKRLVKIWDKMLDKIPFVRTIYSAIKQVVSAMVKPSAESFSKVLLIEYPRRGIWSVAFQTSAGFTGVPTQDDMITVFIPTTPNPTSGLLTIVARKDATELNMSVEEAIKMIISLGVMIPEHMLTPEGITSAHERDSKVEES